MGALTGAAAAFVVCGTWGVLLERARTAQLVVPTPQEFSGFVEVSDEVEAKTDGEKDKKERCPVSVVKHTRFPAVSGGWPRLTSGGFGRIYALTGKE